MQRKILVASIVAAVLGTGLIKLHVDQLERELWGGGPIALLALTADLGPGDALGPDHLTAIEIPERFRESRHVPARRKDDLLGLRLAGSVRAGELLMLTDVAGMRAGDRSLSTLVEEGMRAMPIRVAHSGFSNLVRPGDRVDVLQSRSATGGTETITLLENLLVLAVGHDLGDPGEKGRGRGGRVTLHVTPNQGQTLASAESMGVLRLVLRNPTDNLLRESQHAG